MKAQGILFLSKGSPILKPDASGRPQLLLRAVWRESRLIGCEPWTLIWTGQNAADFYDNHRQQLTPGQPIHVQVHSLRGYAVGHLTEIHAQIEHCALAPRSYANSDAGTEKKTTIKEA